MDENNTNDSSIRVFAQSKFPDKIVKDASLHEFAHSNYKVLLVSIEHEMPYVVLINKTTFTYRIVPITRLSEAVSQYAPNDVGLNEFLKKLST